MGEWCLEWFLECGVWSAVFGVIFGVWCLGSVLEYRPLVMIKLYRVNTISFIYTHTPPIPTYTLSLTQIAPRHPALIPSVSNSYGFASFASFSTA